MADNARLRGYRPDTRRASAVLATGVLVLAGASGAQAEPSGGAPLPTYVGVAEVLQLKGGPAYLCLGYVAESLPPAGCGGAVLRGVNARRLPGAHVYANGTVDTAILRVVGTWDGHELTPTRRTVRSKPPHYAPQPVLRTACADPGGSQASDPAGLNSVQHAAAEQADLSYLYVSGRMGEVADVAFTGHLAQHRAALRKLFSGPLCVVRGARTQHSLVALETRITHDQKLLARHGIIAFSWGPFLDREQMSVAVAGPAVRAFLRHRYGAFLDVTGVLARTR
jgi:hypothetical protein